MPTTPLQEMLQSEGAIFGEVSGWMIPTNFGDSVEEHRACRDGAVVVDLSHRGNVRFSGSDAVKFLHGMLSNRVEELLPGEGVYTTFLTRQGKFVTDLHLYRRTDDLMADLAPGMASVLAEAIEMYIIMDQVEVEDLSGSVSTVGLFGPQSSTCLMRAGLGPGELTEHGHTEIDGAFISRELWTGEDGYLLTVPVERSEAIWKTLTGSGAMPAGLTAFDTLTLEAGAPLFGVDMDSSINPMQAGLETKAIDFEKGCYIGQEVIAKIKYLGQINSGLAGIRIEGDSIPAQGARVESNGEDVGALTRAAFCPTLGKVMALGHIHRKAMAPGTGVTVRDDNLEATGEIASLPFYFNKELEDHL